MEDPRSTGLDPLQATLSTASSLLKDLLARANGCVSSFQFRRALEQHGIQEAPEIVKRVRLLTMSSEPTEAPFLHRGRSFYTAEAYRDQERIEAQEAQNAADNENDTSIPLECAEVSSRTNRREEARLVRYIQTALEDIYTGELAPDCYEQFVFDVHNERAGGMFENVDLLAVDWRSEKRFEVATVEAKLDFTAHLVQQAHNYLRFSHRVWIAVRVQAQPQAAASELRIADARLFDYCLEQGMGILACRPTVGRSYEVVPVHWPRRMSPDPVELEAFMERYRPCMEASGVLQPIVPVRRPLAV